MKLKKAAKIGNSDHLVILISSEKELSDHQLSKEELVYTKRRLKSAKNLVELNRLSQMVYVVLCDKKQNYKNDEKLRIEGSQLINLLNGKAIDEVTLFSKTINALPFIEGMLLGNYQFLKYLSDHKEKKNTMKTIRVVGAVSAKALDELAVVTKATNYAKTMVNEPVSFLNATQISKEIKKLGKEANFKVEVFNKSKIEALKMGGLLAVNKGSLDPPTFSVLEWKPSKAKNKTPIVLVGKGVVYDTGGLSLKPTPNSMVLMKSDMGGAAAVIGALYAIAKNKLPVHIIGLIPATDNRPSGNAYAPGDVITMFNKKTVEVLNTDAEGRMILADALSYAQKYKPALVIDIATLTGSAARAIGHYGIVGMGNADEKVMKKLKESGENVYERIVEFPFWDEYNEQLKSDIADITNLGSDSGGAITAGKFLEHFTAYPYLHLDIAGPAFIPSQINYLSKGGTGVGVRLFYDFVKNYSS